MGSLRRMSDPGLTPWHVLLSIQSGWAGSVGKGLRSASLTRVGGLENPTIFNVVVLNF